VAAVTLVLTRLLPIPQFVILLIRRRMPLTLRATAPLPTWNRSCSANHLWWA